jgi:uroporphyrinogen decarboxylase
VKPKDRVIMAITHEEPDRVPLDIVPYYKLGLDDPRGQRAEKLIHLLGVRDEEGALNKLGIDIRNVVMEPSNEFKRSAVNHPKWGWVRFISENEFEDEWGIRYEIGATGEYFHYKSPHVLENVEDADDYEFPDLEAEGRFEKAQEQVKKWKGNYAISCDMERTLFETAWYLRGFRRVIKDLYEDSKFINRFLDRLLKFRIEQGKRFIEMGVNIIRLGDDLGTQTGLIMPPTIWRKYFKPRMKKLIHELTRKNEVFIFYHTDGYIEPLIPEFIEIGIDILNPVQPECNNIAEIKGKFGDRITLHGTISVQETLPFGSLEDVKNEVTTRIKTCGPGGGFILAPAHAIGTDVSLEKVLILYQTALKYGQYPLTNIVERK